MPVNKVDTIAVASCHGCPLGIEFADGKRHCIATPNNKVIRAKDPERPPPPWCQLRKHPVKIVLDLHKGARRRKCDWCSWITRLEPDGTFIRHGSPTASGTAFICPGSGRKPR